jgi:hypothetical protein
MTPSTLCSYKENVKVSRTFFVQEGKVYKREPRVRLQTVHFDRPQPARNCALQSQFPPNRGKVDDGTRRA